MQLGMIGLGRMGGNMVRRLLQTSHQCVVYDRDQKALDALAKDGASGAKDLADLVRQLKAPRAVWVMLPAGGPTEDTINALGDALGETRTLSVFSATDNLIKGGAGQAIQNMNLVLGVPETASLEDPGPWP